MLNEDPSLVITTRDLNDSVKMKMLVNRLRKLPECPYHCVDRLLKWNQQINFFTKTRNIKKGAGDFKVNYDGESAPHGARSICAFAAASRQATIV